MYFRYADDVFFDVIDIHHLDTLKAALENESGLAFTTEVNMKNKLPFLGVMVNCQGVDFVTDMYVKSTNLGCCMNGYGGCTDSYKSGVVRSYLRRAVTLFDLVTGLS